MWKKRAPRNPDPREKGLAEIAAWEAWFRSAHAQRLASVDEFPDRHLVEQERAKIDAQATAMAAKMREQFLARIPER